MATSTFEPTLDVLPASHTWTRPCPSDSDEQVAFFRENGFLLLPRVLSPAELDRLHRELARLVRDHEKLPNVREGFSPEPSPPGDVTGPVFRKVGGMTALSDAFGDLMRHPRILDPLHAICGPEVHLYRDVVMMKAARHGREKPWHQDSVYWPYRPMQLVSALTALDDATPENGCLQVIPGSHKQEIQHYGGELRIELTPEQQANTHFVPMRAGDTLLFHSLLLHASQPNRSNNHRRLAIVSYKPAGLKWIRANPEPEPIVVSKRD